MYIHSYISMYKYAPIFLKNILCSFSKDLNQRYLKNTVNDLTTSNRDQTFTLGFTNWQVLAICKSIYTLVKIETGLSYASTFQKCILNRGMDKKQLFRYLSLPFRKPHGGDEEMHERIKPNHFSKYYLRVLNKTATLPPLYLLFLPLSLNFSLVNYKNCEKLDFIYFAKSHMSSLIWFTFNY